MSENSISVICKAEKKQYPAISKIVKKYNLSHGVEECSVSIKNNEIIHVLNFYDEGLEDVKSLLESLEEHTLERPIAIFYLDTAGESFYCTIIRGVMTEFVNKSELIEAIELDNEFVGSGLFNVSCDVKTISIIRLTLGKTRKEQVLSFFNACIELDSSSSKLVYDKYLELHKKELIDPNSYCENTFTSKWSGNPERIFPNITFVLDKGSDIVVGFDVYNDDLLKLSKDEFQKQRKVDYDGMDYTSSDFLHEKTEVLVSFILVIDGIKSGEIFLRHNLLDQFDENEEIRSCWVQNEGILYCHRNDKSDVSTLLIS